MTFAFSLLGTIGAFAANTPRVQMDNGNAVAIWMAADPLLGNYIQANTFIAGTWGATAATLSDPNMVTSTPVLAVRSSAPNDISAVVVFTAINEVYSIYSLYGIMYPSVGDGWQDVYQISSNTEDVGSDYTVHLDESGNIVTVYTATDDIRSATATMGTTNTWTTGEVISD